MTKAGSITNEEAIALFIIKLSNVSSCIVSNTRVRLALNRIHNLIPPAYNICSINSYTPFRSPFYD